MESLGGLPFWIKPAFWIVRWMIRKGICRKSFMQIKDWLIRGVLYELHIHVVHRWREFSLVKHDFEDLKSTTQQVKVLCDGFRDVMAEILKISNRRMHCSLKILINDQGTTKVATIGRSEPCNRPAEFDRKAAHRADCNTAFASILGINDGKTAWQPYSYFTCNNLPKHGDKFRCDRENWQQWYQSTLVAPLRFRNPGADNHTVLGFLTFDLHSTGEFVGLPDIFDYCFDDYHTLAWKNASIHAAGIMADTMTILLRPYLEGESQNEEAIASTRDSN